MRSSLLRIAVGVISLSVGMVALPQAAQASKTLTTVPAALRGTWYQSDQRGWTYKYVFHKKSVKMSSTWKGKSMGTNTVKLAKTLKYTTKAKWVLFQKQHHSWYGMSLNNANGITEMKRSTYKIKGKKYQALYIQSMGGTGRTPKKMMVGVAFHKNFNHVYTKRVATKGMLK